jgi:hypothetical protein
MCKCVCAPRRSRMPGRWLAVLLLATIAPALPLWSQTDRRVAPGPLYVQLTGPEGKPVAGVHVRIGARYIASNDKGQIGRASCRERV